MTAASQPSPSVEDSVGAGGNTPSSPSFSYADSFTPTRSRKKRKGRQQGREPPSAAVLLERTLADLAADAQWTLEAKHCLRDALAASPSGHVPRDSAFPSLKVLCLGLGSPAVSRDARAQLAFLLSICTELSIDRENVSVYDPVFTEEDVHLLGTLCITRLPENRHAAHGLAERTIVFMPHCDLQLYENLLRANWSSSGLANLLLIANRLSEYVDRVPSRKLSVEHPCVWRLAPYLASRPLPSCPAYPTAFNNTSIQWPRLHDIAQAEDADAWWELPAPLDAPQDPDAAKMRHQGC